MRTARIVMIFLFVSGPTFAGTWTGGASQGAARAACRGDAYKFCGAVIRDADKRHACMVAHSAQLSSGCRAMMSP